MTTPNVFYLVTTNWADLGFGSCGDPVADFDAAVDQMTEARDDGRGAEVWQLQPATGDMINVTDAAIKRAEHFWRCNGVDAPEWAEGNA